MTLSLPLPLSLVQLPNDTKENENVIKTIGLISTCITLLRTFLCRYCTTTTWKCLTSLFTEDVSDVKISSLSELGYGSLEFKYWRVSQWDEIIAMKIERTQIHFLSNVVPSMPSSNLKVPNGKRLYSNGINGTHLYRRQLLKIGFSWRGFHITTTTITTNVYSYFGDMVF